MAEHALSYVITLIVVCNVIVIAGLAAIVVVAPQATRRRPAHRAETALLRSRLSRLPVRPSAARPAAAPATRAA